MAEQDSEGLTVRLSNHGIAGIMNLSELDRAAKVMEKAFDLLGTDDEKQKVGKLYFHNLYFHIQTTLSLHL